MDEIISNCEVMNGTEHSSVVSDSLLYVDIKPWVLRLQAVAQTVKQFIAVKDVAEIEQAWADYRAGINKANTLSTADEFMARHMSGFGSDGISTEPRLTHASYRYLTPFVDYLKEKLSMVSSVQKPNVRCLPMLKVQNSTSERRVKSILLKVL